jgi:GNAT superfamily N-acetyltransferase
MSYRWIRENPPHWDAPKAEIIGGADEGIFDFGAPADGDVLSGDWWRVEDDGRVVGYGWMDCTWGDAEILLAVAASHRGKGAGTFILDHLEHEAASHGVNYMFNVVRESHPDPEGITRWLGARRFEPSHDRLRRRVGGSDS